MLKVTMKATAQHLGGKKRARLVEYLFRRLIFAVLHSHAGAGEDKSIGAHCK